jgi:ribonuclease P protein component
MPTFKKHERLCSKKLLDQLFADGKSMLMYPVKFTFLEIKLENLSPAQVVFIVPKKRFKKANKRNLIRRRMREAYRLEKDNFYTELYNNNLQAIISISYVANELLSYGILKEQIFKGLNSVGKALQKNKVS